MNVLDQIIANKRLEVAQLRQSQSLESFSKSVYFDRVALSLKESLLSAGFGIIAEIKRKSPSGGNIKTELDVTEQAQFYEQNGAAGISILTDSTYFGGSIDDILKAREAVNIPLLRKEFIIDEIQLYEAKAIGADAILLIGAVLQPKEAQQLTNKAHELGLEVLYEVHTPEEIAHIPPNADLIAVNNRDLKAQKTSLEHSFKLAPLLPAGIPLISASGIKTAEEIAALKAASYSGALIGESILRDGHLAQLTQNLTP
ncbi:hypothetical protein AM493_19530 [Flavobacterium akiainvivens]|uniref:indole-3-glycerol-phosphate synthase n=1 Tax=Flavobacterium akiainvivens TaxID=1202724 RepID=A0A0N0RR42_9FLAO|nr:indole-3-glycerol phosphate synthase TrpC [Flavobacterium akiainvivens]KOS07999.1 hypothetical protein AM493_19530 [Flavobacterium akiainvivens]SFQ61769.1 indole-3-glycerol phosphate synthase [Flavobacterium akiainvivens]